MLPRPSYRNISPVESGGERARQGFTFQDHVAAGYCIDMLLNAGILEVWCELLDDITIVRNQAGQEEFEFVQVKSNKLDQLWSVAKLCERDQKNPGTSILEKLFANERGAEPCRFRIVTCRDVNNELKVLTLPLNSPVRTAPNNKFTHLCQQVSEKLPNYKSPIGSDTSSGLSRTEWDVRYSEEAIREKNLSNIRAFGECIGVFLSAKQWTEIYEKILYKVKEAGEANWEINLDAKKFKRNKFLDWIIPLIKLADVPENLPHSAIRQFVSREEELETLHRQLQEDGAMSAIIGMRGVGKTELARQYALKYKGSYPGGICWLHAKEDIRLKIIQFAKSRLQLDVPYQQDLSAQVGFCWTYWNRPGRVLVLLDDVNNFTEIEPFLPPQNERFRVLITTHWKFDDLPFSLTLHELKEVAALELLAQWVKTEQIFCNVTTKEDVPSELCARLGHLPLALHLVGRYIKKRRVTLMEMLQRLEGKGLRHPALQVDQNDRTQTIRIERGVAAAFELSWEELSESAQRLGYSLSLCASTHTAWSLIKSVTNESELEELEDARVELESLHLLQVQDKDLYQLHSLIREFFQDKLGSTDKLLQSIKQRVDEVIGSDTELQHFLTWVNQKSGSVKNSYNPDGRLKRIRFSSLYPDILCKLAAIRAFYFDLALVHNSGLALPLYHKVKAEFSNNFGLRGLSDHRLTSEFELSCAIEPGLAPYLHFATDLGIVGADDLAIDSALDSNLEFAYSHIFELKFRESLKKLKEQLPTIDRGQDNFENWWQSNGQTWTEQLRKVMIEHRNVGHDRQFREEQKEKLKHYYDTNKLLVNCLNDDCKVNPEVREAIEETLLLPVAEIERRKREGILG
ncbi:DUF4297 domain-containing protein [Microcoleus sp. FACHB-831]|uniref:dsDNA nuclease domain-containing protein n=1 Tax=Microcoleus sp. FACHB-831 TaxID=2692827 RepID=UPI0016877CCB|nr:dsDNA nuclease domain-containing protein [Microcoleus sp. FACHB-831]MBD1919763.1 DUF4297 domain-containing protein [Microcoleus sp. FACHB-831]